MISATKKPGWAPGFGGTRKDLWRSAGQASCAHNVGYTSREVKAAFNRA